MLATNKRWLKHAVQFHTKEQAGYDAHRLGAFLHENPFRGLKGTWAFDKKLAAHCWTLGWQEAERKNPRQNRSTSIVVRPYRQPKQLELI